jgi:hypothetical protein
MITESILQDSGFFTDGVSVENTTVLERTEYKEPDEVERILI